jgi:NADPH:quinone reductase
MRAVYITEFNHPDGLCVRDIDAPGEPARDEVLVKVHAAGVNRADILQAKGLYPPPPRYSPHLPGLEFAGEVAAVADSEPQWKIGDRVFGIVPAAGQAEFVLTDSSLLARIPDTLTYVEGAAVPEAFITAHDAIFTQGMLAIGETLLIHAIGSGVGLAGLQIAKAAGAGVIGTSRTADKLERCREFGLDVGIQAANGDFAEQVREATGGRGVDVVMDLVGGSYFSQDLMCLAPKGRLMLVGLTAGRKADFDMGLALQKRLTIKGTVLRSRTLDEKADATARFAADVLPLIAAGKIRPNVDSVFPLSEVKRAYERVMSNENFGKVILEF